MDTIPQPTIYVNNLPDKLKRDELKKCLYAVFSQFGKILDIVAMKTYRLRGQAWVVFDDITSATNALRAMQSFPFFEKPMRISFAKTDSDATLKKEGKWKPKDQEARKRKNEAANAEHLKRSKDKVASGAPSVAAASRAAAGPTGSEPPNKILFVQNLPAATTAPMLSMLFTQFPGFKEVRLVEARPGIAFVEYETDAQSATALNGLQNFNITPTNAMAISYAKQ